MGRISNGCVVARVRWLTHTGREASPSGLKSVGAKRVGERCIRVDFRRVSEAGFAAQPIIEQAESPDTLSIFAQDPLPLRLCTFAPLRSFPPTAGISARDPLPLRLCTFAPLRSFLPTAGISSRDTLPLRLCTFASLRSFLPTALRAVFPLAPPAPYSPSQSPGGEGEPSGLGGCDGIVVDRSWGEWLFGFSPEGGTWTAGVRKPPDLGNHPGTS